MKFIKNQKGFTGLEIILLVVVLGGVGFVGYRAYQAQPGKAPAQEKVQPTQNKEVSKSSIPEGWIEYKNEEFGFAFAYPQAYGSVQATPTYGTENRNGRLIQITFTKMCDTCKAGETNPFAIDMRSPGLVEIGAASPQFGGVGTGRPMADSAGYTINSNGTVTFKRSIGQAQSGKYPTFQANNTNGILVQMNDEWQKAVYTGIIFNLKHSELTGIEFMTHDYPGQGSNADNLKSIAKTFRLL